MLAGSSPLTRGKRHARRDGRRRARLIPAHAGKTLSQATSRAGGRAHPRSRGENLKEATDRLSAAGSSPLTRGKRDLIRVAGYLSGLIPAHAGKTAQVTLQKLELAAHPRSRGENPAVVRCHLMVYGSSPLTRGKPDGGDPGAARSGLIPAHAGKTMPPRSPRPPARAHPRSRGENSC